MTQLNKTAVTGLESGPVGVLPPPSRSGSVSPVAGRGRHSTRISVSLPVMVQDHLGTREQALTHSVTSRGAILLLKSNVHVAQTITVQNLRNKKSAECHVIGVENMVNHLHKVEVEFTSTQTDFWPVQFPQEREQEHSPEMGNGHSHIDRGNIAELSPEQASTSGRREEVATDSHQISSDPPPANSSEEPPIVQDSDIALVLAAPIKPGSASAEPFHVRSFSSSAASMDSVAQFRAATRSASRRKQQIRSISFVVSLAVAVSAVLAGRTMLRHHPLHLMRSSSMEVPETVSANTNTQPAAEATDAPAVPSSVETPQIVPQPSDAAATILTASSGGEQITLPPMPSSGAPAEIAVRHGSTLPKPALAEDEPIALPLRAANENKAGAEINQVLARAPHTNAVLAPRPVLRPARLLSTVRPEYPATARQYRVEGEVIMTVEIEPSGAVAEVKVVSGPPMLRIAATSAVRQWKYQPATYGDKPVSSSVTAKLDFHLR